MQKSLILHKIAALERHIRESERHLLHQREIVNELERHGRGNSRTTKIAREILASFEMTQSTSASITDVGREKIELANCKPRGFPPRSLAIT